VSYIPDRELENLISHGVTILGRNDDGLRIYCFTKPCVQVGFWDITRGAFVSQDYAWTSGGYHGLWRKRLQRR